MEVLKKYKNQIYFHLVLNLAVAGFVTFASLIHIPLNNWYGYFLNAGLFLIIQFTVFGFLYLLSLSRFFFKLGFPGLFLLLCISSYWVYAHDITISQSIVHVAFETKPDIAIDLITVPFVIFMLLAISVVFLLLKWFQNLEVIPWKSPL